CGTNICICPAASWTFARYYKVNVAEPVSRLLSRNVGKEWLFTSRDFDGTSHP
ncbi:hypothetical protein M9458_002958, partial [Cirrhinus mrigala]